MKLLYITNGINGSGGLERVLSIKASGFAEKQGYDVHILGLNQGNEKPFYEFSPKIKFESILVAGNPLQYWKSYIKGIQNVVDEIQPDIISVCDDGLKGFFNSKPLLEPNGLLINELDRNHFLKNYFQMISQI